MRIIRKKQQIFFKNNKPVYDANVRHLYATRATTPYVVALLVSNLLYILIYKNGFVLFLITLYSLSFGRWAAALGKKWICTVYEGQIATPYTSPSFSPESSPRLS